MLMKSMVVAVVLSAGLASAVVFADARESAELTKSQKQEAVEALAKTLEQTYIFEDLGKRAASDLRASLKSGKYDSFVGGEAFAKAIHAQVNGIIKDAHFHVQYNPQGFSTDREANQVSTDDAAAEREMVRRTNAAFEKVERLPGNVGYIKFNMFFSLADAKRPAQSAMEFVENTDALIFDLRDNGGGEPETVQFICSYLFEGKPVHLNSLIWRDGRKEEFWTIKDVPGTRYLNKPVYVLTSKNTGSAAEEFAYNLQQLKRATVIGGVTWGGANPGAFVPLGSHFMAFVPNGRAENPYTKDNWEGKGVKPDVEVDPAKAINRAHRLAISEQLKTVQGPPKQGLENLLKRLEAEG
jgi:hypothetical protein